jgi:hypothetical protein
MMIGALDDGSVVHDRFLFQVFKDAAYVFVDSEESGIVVFGHLFHRANCIIGVCSHNLVVGNPPQSGTTLEVSGCLKDLLKILEEG